MLLAIAVLLAAVILSFVDGRFEKKRPALSRLLWGLSAISAASAGLPFYAEARFSVLVYYAAAGENNPFIRLWNDAKGEARTVLHYSLWIYASFALAFAAIGFAAAELIHSEQVPPTRVGSRFRRLRWHLSRSKASVALVLVLVYSCAIWIGKTLDRGSIWKWGVDWEYGPNPMAHHHGRPFWQNIIQASVFYAGFGGLLPMTLIGLPLSRTSALWRAMGRSYEEAIGFHRALGHVMMALFTYHSIGYMVVFLVRGWETFLEEMGDWLDCGRCTHINNLAGFVSWFAGFLLWLTSLKWARRRNFALFFNTHQLHLVFFAFGCIHWPTILAYSAPSIVFYAADAALRFHTSRARVPTIARVRPSKDEPSITTLVFANTAGAATAPSPACPHTRECMGMAAQRGDVRSCPAARAGGVAGAPVVPPQPRARTEEWSGGCVYLAVPAIGRLPYLQWHPFSIGGSADDGAALVVHVTRCRRWTKRLTTFVTSQKDAAVAGGDDKRLQLHVIGPIPAPPALLDCVADARAGVPLLLVGGGSGIVPLVAILRRLANEPAEMPANASVHLVLVVRELCAVEQLLDGRLLPNGDVATGTTGHAWLRCEIFLTSKDQVHVGGEEERGLPYDATRIDRAPEVAGDASTPTAGAGVPADLERCSVERKCHRGTPLLSGPFHITADNHGLRATAAPFATLTSHHEPTGVPLQAYEAASLLGAVVGYMAIAWPLVWRGDTAPWARRNAPTATTGGGGFVIATVCAWLLAALLLWLCDLASIMVSRLRAWPGRQQHTAKATSCSISRGSSSSIFRERDVGVELDDSFAAVAEDVVLTESHPQKKEGGAQTTIPPVGAISVAVPLAGRKRPEMGQLLQRTPQEARVAVGGPPSMVKALSKALSAAGRPPSVCLTHSM